MYCLLLLLLAALLNLTLGSIHHNPIKAKKYALRQKQRINPDLHFDSNISLPESHSRGNTQIIFFLLGQPVFAKQIEGKAAVGVRHGWWKCPAIPNNNSDPHYYS